MRRRAGEVGISPAPTHEPPVIDSEFAQLEVFLTGEDVEECVGLRIHGAVHYLHSTSARVLERRLNDVLGLWNQSVRDFKRSHPGDPMNERIQEV